VVTEHDKTALPSDLAGTMFIAMPIPAGGDLKLAVAPAADSIRKALRDAEPRLHKAIDYYSCFISYSWKDREFVTMLHADLQEVGVRCWLDEKELHTGDHVAEQIDRALQAHDKVLLILSDSSVRSTWVRLELRNALQLEKERRKTVLFPLRLDESALKISGPEFDRLRDKYITDF
jgi:hypothetical protein